MAQVTFGLNPGILHRYDIIHATLFIFSFCVYAEKIPFVWHTEYNNKDTVVPVEWNEKWFGQKSSFEYNHDIARIACFFSDAEKDVHLKNYSLLGISNKDVELNYNMNYTDQKKNSPRKRALKLLRKADQKNL